MISYIDSLPAGNAIKVLLQPPVAADRWILLRKSTDTFSGASDPAAIVIHDGGERFLLDTTGLVNGETVYYRAYYFSGLTLISQSMSRSASSGSTFQFASLDAVSVVRDRIDLGLQSLVQRGAIQHPRNLIPVMIASPLIEEAIMPIVTVHLASDSSEMHGVGNLIDDNDMSGIGDDIEGWYSRYQLDIMGWSLNSDQRKLLRSALKHILLINRPVFEYAGIETIDLQMSDAEDFESYKAPVYMVNCTMRFLAPSVVSAPADRIIDVFSTFKE